MAQHGVQLLGHLLTVRATSLKTPCDTLLLHALMHTLCCVHEHQPLCTLLLQHVLLEWRIWVHSELSVQLLLLQMLQQALHLMPTFFVSDPNLILTDPYML